MLVVKTSPVATTVSFFSAPPFRSESRSGLNRTSTVSPGLTASRRQPPARTRLPGLVISITQTAAPSSARSLTRIDPAQLYDLAVDRHGFGMVEHAGGMMRRHRCNTGRDGASNGEHADGLEIIRHEIDSVA